MRVVIVAEAGRLREGLRMMLASMLDLEVVTVVDNGPLALEVIRNWQPDLVILDVHLLGERAARFVSATKRAWNGVRCIAVAERLGQFKPLRDVGTDTVLLKGFTAAELSDAISQLSQQVPG
jgi:DNA-binding NarL/FixJ family response regulator